jgi:hypothetical protein
MQCDGTDAAEVASAVEAHGADAVAAAFVALVTSLIELLGRIVGVEMATRLVEHAGAGGAAPDSIDGKGGHHE